LIKRSISTTYSMSAYLPLYEFKNLETQFTFNVNYKISSKYQGIVRKYWIWLYLIVLLINPGSNDELIDAPVGYLNLTTFD